MRMRDEEESCKVEILRRGCVQGRGGVLRVDPRHAPVKRDAIDIFVASCCSKDSVDPRLDRHIMEFLCIVTWGRAREYGEGGRTELVSLHANWGTRHDLRCTRLLGG